jgi:Tfp pilus assembly protein PilV
MKLTLVEALDALLFLVVVVSALASLAARRGPQ